MTPAFCLRQFLINTEVVSEAGEWPAYVAFFPPDSVRTVSLYDTEGILHMRSHRTMKRPEHFGFQLLVRCDDYLHLFAKVRAIADAFDNAYNTTFVMLHEEVTYDVSIHTITRTSPPIPLGVEETSKRTHQVTLNGLVLLQID